MHDPSPAIAIIPARFASTRFPGKPLANRTGKPLIQHVIERVQRCQRVARIVVATDDRRILEAVEAFGGRAVMTGADHPNGTSRLAEVAASSVSDDASGRDPILVNVQGDEPEIDPAVIDRLIDAIAADPSTGMATVACPFGDDEDPADPNLVKVVVDQRSRALYFSRALIPHHRDASSPGRQPCLKHVGLYAYRRDFLLQYVTLPPTPLEDAEKLEQLRVLEHGHPIAVLQMSTPAHPGIDTPQQYEAFVKRQSA